MAEAFVAKIGRRRARGGRGTCDAGCPRFSHMRSRARRTGAGLVRVRAPSRGSRCRQDCPGQCEVAGIRPAFLCRGLPACPCWPRARSQTWSSESGVDRKLPGAERVESTWATFRALEDFRLFVGHGRRASLNRGDGRAGDHAHARRNERSLVMTSPQNEKQPTNRLVELSEADCRELLAPV